MKSTMRRQISFVIVTAVLLAGPMAFAQRPRVNNDNVKREPFRMIGNIHWVGHSQVGAFLLTTPAGLILIDSTSTNEWPWVRENIEKLGFNVRDIKVLLNLHPHEEHMGGMARFKELTGAKLIVSEAAAAEMAVGGRTDFREDGSERYTPVKADQTDAAPQREIPEHQRGLRDVVPAPEEPAVRRLPVSTCPDDQAQ